ncbi:MSHA biogenesis protein MshK [Shewanella abyssi]|uniref:MSHA biogenesis protein MshK n=1 Tax=Shewanella abyssi TaxID=311789 RepID=UPI00200DA1CF|nr:MSHA biogenesis protein MshK [Shewanella abyssi]
MLLKQISRLVLLIVVGSYCVNLSAASLRDPTLPGAGASITNTATVSVNKSLTLNSVLIKQDGSLAVINNEIFKQGQRVQGVKIVHIGKDTVSLADGRKLTMFKTITEIKGQ